MAWGIFKKIKAGLKKAWNFGKKFVGKVIDVAKKAAPAISTIANTFVPGSGAVVDKVINTADGIRNTLMSNKIKLK